MPTDKRLPLNTLVRPASKVVVRPATHSVGLDTGLPSTDALLKGAASKSQPATLDEELSMIKARIEEARASPANGPTDGDITDEHTRAYFPRGTETLADGYIHRLSARREPAPSNNEVPVGREYRRRRNR